MNPVTYAAPTQLKAGTKPGATIQAYQLNTSGLRMYKKIMSKYCKPAPTVTDVKPVEYGPPIQIHLGRGR